MIHKSFNRGWRIIHNESWIALQRQAGDPVNLPYDNMLDHKRTKDAPSGSNTGFYPDTVCTLVKRFPVPIEWIDKSIILDFEGIYTNSMIYINGDYAGGCPHGYTQFYVPANNFLKYGEENEIKVVAKTNVDSRWYTGAGIYRNVWVLIGDLLHIKPDGYRIDTPEIDDYGSTVEITSILQNQGHTVRRVKVETVIKDAEGKVVSSGSEIVTAFPGEETILRQRLYIENPCRWSIEHPYLYKAESKITDGTNRIDQEESYFGIRTLSLDVHHGLRINGDICKLRGACIHHDNGIIGSAAIGRAEERRAELLKKAGFNAVRSAHNPISRAFLHACDRIGLVVMDELTDIWFRRKNDYDYSTAFPNHWEKAVKSMVAKDYNHPSVIMYSIGNEIPEVGTAHGAAMGRKLSEKIRRMDRGRYTINSVNLMLSAINAVEIPIEDKGEDTGINELMTQLEGDIGRLTDSEYATECTREDFSTVDISGYNYATGRYLPDKLQFPNRIICGSETFPKQIAENWKIILNNNHVIGDFTWTGWDYLGEAGIGKTRYIDEEKPSGVYSNYPCYIAYCGDIDIIGNRRPVSYYREIVFGLRKEPYIAVQYPNNYSRTRAPGNWDFIDGISSWTWKGYEGKPVKIEVYSPGNTVELRNNGTVVGKAEIINFKAELEVQYLPGELMAVAYQNGMEISHTSIFTAGEPASLAVNVDRDTINNNDEDLAYIMLSLVDEKGIINTGSDQTVYISVEGAGELLGFGSANPVSEESFRQNHFNTFHGQALAVIRPVIAGDINLTVWTEKCGKEHRTIHVV